MAVGAHAARAELRTRRPGARTLPDDQKKSRKEYVTLSGLGLDKLLSSLTFLAGGCALLPVPPPLTLTLALFALLLAHFCTARFAFQKHPALAGIRPAVDCFL